MASRPWDEEVWEEDEPLSSRRHSEYPYFNESQSSLEYTNLDESHSSLEYTNLDGSHSSRTYSTRHRPTFRENCNFDIVTGRKTEDFECEVIIEQGDIGKIIGKGGNKIREMEEISGAKIRIFSENKAEDPYVLISGPDLARDRGRELLENLIANIREAAKFKAVKQVQPPTTATQPVGDSFFETIDWDALKIDSDIARKKKLAALPKIKKDFYCEDREIAAWSSKEVDIFRIENNNIVVSKVEEKDRRPIPNPVKTFAQAFHNYPEILKEVLKQGFSTPSPIQCQSWPILLRGHDLIGIAQTGTGKTIAFLLPALIHIDNQLTPRKNRPGPTCLILAPTRELAQQIEQEAKKYNYRGIKCVCVYGGGNRREQINVVARGVEIVIATPGRLNDLIMNNIVDVTSVTYLI